MAVNYNILNKISDKYVNKQIDEKLEQCYCYIFFPHIENKYHYIKPIPKIIKGVSSKNEAYLKIIKNDYLVMYDFLISLGTYDFSINVQGVDIPIQIFEYTKKLRRTYKSEPYIIYNKLKSVISNIDDIIIEYMNDISDAINGYVRHLMIDKFNVLEKIE